MCKKLFYLVLVLGMCFSLAHGQEGLIGHWRFDESSGTIAADSSGDDNNGALSENVEWQPFDGKLGGALLFDGESTAHVEISTEGMSASEGTVSVGDTFRNRSLHRPGTSLAILHSHPITTVCNCIWTGKTRN